MTLEGRLCGTLVSSKVHWLEEDAGPGSKLLGAVDWFRKSIGMPIPQHSDKYLSSLLIDESS